MIEHKGFWIFNFYGKNKGVLKKKTSGEKCKGHLVNIKCKRYSQIINKIIDILIGTNILFSNQQNIVYICHAWYTILKYICIVA
jgi:hypothetical protein